MLKVLIGAVLVALVAAPPALAEGTVTPLHKRLVAGRQELAGPSFAGDGIAWATPSSLARDYDVSVSRRATRETEHVPSGSSGVELSDSFAASAQSVALAVKARDCDDPECKGFLRLAQSAVFAGPIGQPLSFERCGAGENAPESVDLEGSVIAYLDSCAGGVAVHDLSAPPGAPTRVFPGNGAARIAGPYVAVASNTEIVVYEWSTGHELYRVESGLVPFDLRSDGVLAFARAGELDWASPQEPFPHRIADAGSSVTAARISGSRVAVRTGERFEVFDLDGTTVGTASATDAVGDFDFDGARLVSGAQPCEVTSIVTWDVAGVAPKLPPGLCPSAQIVGRTGDVDLSRSTFTVRVRCPSTPGLGCTGVWFQKLHVTESSSHAWELALAPGQRRSVRFRMFGAETCAFALHHAHRVDVYLWSADTRRRQKRGSHKPAVITRFRLSGRAPGCRRSRG